MCFLLQVHFHSLYKCLSALYNVFARNPDSIICFVFLSKYNVEWEKGSLSSYFWREFSAFERCSINSPRDRERYRRGIARVGSLSPPSLLLCCKWWMSSTLLICPGLVGSATRRLIHTSSFPLLTAMPDKKIFTKSRGRNILLLTN